MLVLVWLMFLDKFWKLCHFKKEPVLFQTMSWGVPPHNVFLLFAPLTLSSLLFKGVLDACFCTVESMRVWVTLATGISHLERQNNLLWCIWKHISCVWSKILIYGSGGDGLNLQLTSLKVQWTFPLTYHALDLLQFSTLAWFVLRCLLILYESLYQVYHSEVDLF